MKKKEHIIKYTQAYLSWSKVEEFENSKHKVDGLLEEGKEREKWRPLVGLT